MSTTTEPVSRTTSSLDAVFRPESIAIIGCSRRRGTIGYQIVDNILDHGYTGALHLVNPNVRAVHSIPTKASVLDIDGPVDLAVITVPKELVLGVAEQCGEKGVRALVVITALFVLTLPWIGINIGLFLTMLTSMWVLGERDWRALLGWSVGTTATVYLVFVMFLRTKLPTGPIEALIRWLAGGGA